LNVDNFLCDTIAEVFVVWIVAHINEREAGDAFLRGWHTREFLGSCDVRQFLGRLRISKLGGVEINDPQLCTMFYFNFAKLV